MSELRINYRKVCPDALAGMYASNTYFDGCGVSQALRRLVELRVSQINGCTYCIWLHSRQLRELGDPDAKIGAVEGWRLSELFSATERAALEWAELVTRIAEGPPPDESFAHLRRHLDERQTVELTAIVANMNALNRVAVSMRLEAPRDA